jgi:hypothetical protein
MEVYNVALRMLGGLAAAEDAVQDSPEITPAMSARTSPQCGSRFR